MAGGRWGVGPFRGYQDINGYQDSPSVMTQEVWVSLWQFTLLARVNFILTQPVSKSKSPRFWDSDTSVPHLLCHTLFEKEPQKTRSWLLVGWFVWYIIPPPSRHQVGMVYDYTYIYLLYSGILCTRISYLRTGFRLGRLSKSARGVVTQDRVLRGTLGQICQHAPMVNAPVTVERFLAPWRWAERINMRREKPIIMISMYPDVKVS